MPKPTYHELLRPHKARFPHDVDQLVGLAKHYNDLFGLPENLIPSAAKEESNFDYLAKSPTGPLGLMQLGGSARQEVGVIDPFNPEKNLMGGAAYYRHLLDNFKVKPKNIKELSAMYTEGPGAGGKMIKGKIPYSEQARNHYEKLQRTMERMGLVDHLVKIGGEPSKRKLMEIDIIGGNGTLSEETLNNMLKEFGLDQQSPLTTKHQSDLSSKAQGILERYKQLYPEELPSKVELSEEYDPIKEAIDSVYKYDLESEDYLPMNRWR